MLAVYRAALLFLILVLVSPSCRATIIVFTITRDAIFLGADGRLTMIDKDGQETYGEGCKIKKYGRIAVAYSGTSFDPATNFDLWTILSSFKATTVDDFAVELKEVLPSRLQAAMEANKGRMKPSFLPGDVIVAAFEDGKPALARILFLNANGTVKASVKNEGKEFARNLKLNPGVQFGPNPVGEYIAIGLGDFAKLNCHSTESGPMDNEQQIRCCIKAYIDADPKHINEPVSLVKITNEGTTWVEKGKCEDAGMR